MKKEYTMNLGKRYEVEFVKDGAVYKKGSKVNVNMALASKFYKQGKIKVPDDLKSDAVELGCAELFGVTKKAEKTE